MNRMAGTGLARADVVGAVHFRRAMIAVYPSTTKRVKFVSRHFHCKDRLSRPRDHRIRRRSSRYMK